MTVVMAVPAMVVMVRMSNLDNDLGARCRYQRSEEQKSENSKTKFLHNYSDAQPMRQVVALGRRIGIACARPDIK
jgi:hypothetical protein